MEKERKEGCGQAHLGLDEIGDLQFLMASISKVARSTSTSFAAADLCVPRAKLGAQFWGGDQGMRKFRLWESTLVISHSRYQPWKPHEVDLA